MVFLGHPNITKLTLQSGKIRAPVFFSRSFVRWAQPHPSATWNPARMKVPCMRSASACCGPSWSRPVAIGEATVGPLLPLRTTIGWQIWLSKNRTSHRHFTFQTTLVNWVPRGTPTSRKRSQRLMSDILLSARSMFPIISRSEFWDLGMGNGKQTTNEWFAEYRLTNKNCNPLWSGSWPTLHCVSPRIG